MNQKDGADHWLSQNPAMHPWDASEYNQLIFAGPLLPLLEQYVSMGTVNDQKKGQLSCYGGAWGNGIVLMSYHVTFSQGQTQG